MKHRNKVVCGLCAGLALLACGSAGADYTADFEAPTFNGSAGGVLMTGQDGWYQPVDPGDDYNVYTYAGNVLGVNANPQGSSQFVAGYGPADAIYARAQHDVDWTLHGQWLVEYDVAALYDGQPPGADNLGSFSVQPSAGTVGSYIHLFSWVDPTVATNWKAFVMHYDAAGVQVPQPGTSPGPEWDNLELNHWYRFETLLDFDVNQIIEVGITDLTTGDSAHVEVTDWFLSGGEGAGPPTVTAFRFFAGGGVPGNIVAWDNLTVVPEPAMLCMVLLGGLVALRRR
jgi:hypothetical protein